MVKALGIDPGTRSFDLALIEGETVIWERSIDTVKIAEDPNILIEAVDEVKDVDIIAGPSGYGVPLTYNNEITDPRRFALEVILLTREEDLIKGVAAGELGIKVYEAITKVVVEFWKRKLPICYIPSSILLPTIPSYRKINKLDMGTADKMAIAVLGVYDQSKRFGIEYDDVSFILLEMGFGYNAVLGIDKGKIIDGLGGTLISTGFLTIGPLDAELAVMGKNWVRSDVFHGGVADICGTIDLDLIIKGYQNNEEPFYTAINSFLEGIRKGIAAILATVKDPKEILISGRNSRHPVLIKLIRETLEDIAPTRNIGLLNGAKISKEAAQGYAIVAEGVGGGVFSKLIKHMGILEAKGTVLDYVYHPRLIESKKWLTEAYRKSVKNPKLQ